MPNSLRTLIVSTVGAGILVVTACSSSPTPSPSESSELHPTTEPSLSTPFGAPSPTGSDAVALADPICRDSAFRDPGELTVAVIQGDLVTIVYTSPEGDMLCQYLPRYGDSAVIQGGFEHHADAVSADNPFVVEGNLSWTSETGTYVWGAVGREVSSVVVVLDPQGDPAPAAGEIEAALADGYFLAVIGPKLPCCTFTAIALAADGTELARYP